MAITSDIGLLAPKIKFVCEICGDEQEIAPYVKPNIKICNQCKADLKELVLKVRTKHF